MAEVPEAEEPLEPVEAAASAAPDAGAAAVALALARKRGGRAAKPDALDDYLKEQTRLLRLQSEHLHEQRALQVEHLADQSRHLRLRGLSERLNIALKLATMVVGVAVALGVGAMAWQAREAHGLAIEAFSVPPDLARAGLNGQVAASRFLDRLQALQTATENSDRPSQSYATDWGSDFKVEIPETGLTFSEFDKLLRERLGHVDHVTGEVVAVPEGVALTARLGEDAPRTFAGPATAFDALAQQAAEAVYRSSQPYRYTEYLDSQPGRAEEAFQVISGLAEHGPPSERGWAYARWATMDLNDHGDVAAARRHVALGQGRGEGSDILVNIARISNEVWTGREEASLQASTALAAAVQKRQPDTSAFFRNENRLLARAWLQFVQADYPASGSGWMKTFAEDFSSDYARLMPAMAATSFALGHDLPSARRALAQGSGEPDADLAWPVARGAFPALPRYWMAAETGDWRAALADAKAFDAVLDAGRAQRPIYGLLQQTWIWPLEALALAHTGDAAGAEALVERTPADCYLCLRVRGLIAAQRRDWPAASRWIAEAQRQAPSLALAFVDGARIRLRQGDVQGALAQLEAAQAKAPRLAEVEELRGEALMARRDFGGAADRFARADRLAPRWGRNHLMWGEALMLANRRGEARGQYAAASALDLDGPDRAALQVLLARG